MQHKQIFFSGLVTLLNKRKYLCCQKEHYKQVVVHWKNWKEFFYFNKMVTDGDQWVPVECVRHIEEKCSLSLQESFDAILQITSSITSISQVIYLLLFLMTKNYFVAKNNKVNYLSLFLLTQIISWLRTTTGKLFITVT